MKKTLLGFIILALFSFSADKNAFEIGDKAPLSDVEMPGVDGKNYTIKDNLGKRGLVLIFSCNTCPFVVGSESFAGWEKDYNGIYKKAKELDMNVILVNSNEAKRDGDDSFDKMKERSKEKEYAMPYVVDSLSRLANAFGAKTTPHVFVLNREMELIYKGAIDNSWDTQKTEDIKHLDLVFEAVKTQTKIETATTDPRGCSIKRVK